MTQIKQDTQTVHLLGAKGKALCKAKPAPVGVAASDWLAGFTPAGLGTRICRACEQQAGTAASFAPGEREAERQASGLTPQDWA